MNTHFLVHLDSEQREGSPHGVAQETVRGHGRCTTKWSVDIEHVQRRRDEHGDVSECEWNTGENRHDPVDRWLCGEGEPDESDGEAKIANHADVQSLFWSLLLDAITTLRNHLLIHHQVKHDGSNGSEDNSQANAEECQAILPDLEVVLAHEDDGVGFEEGEQDAESESVVDRVQQDNWLCHEHGDWSEQRDGEQHLDGFLGRQLWLRWWKSELLRLSVKQDLAMGLLCRQNENVCEEREEDR